MNTRIVASQKRQWRWEQQQLLKPTSAVLESVTHIHDITIGSAVQWKECSPVRPSITHTSLQQSISALAPLLAPDKNADRWANSCLPCKSLSTTKNYLNADSRPKNSLRMYHWNGTGTFWKRIMSPPGGCEAIMDWCVNLTFTVSLAASVYKLCFRLQVGWEVNRYIGLTWISSSWQRWASSSFSAITSARSSIVFFS